MRPVPTLPSRRSSWVALTAAAVVGLALLWLLGLRGHSGDETRSNRAEKLAPKVEAAERRGGSSNVREAPGLEQSGEALPASRAGHFDERRLESALADFQARSVYPPTSQPHERGSAYKLRWNEPFIDDAPLEQDGREPSGESTFRFGVDRVHVGPGEPLTSWIEVRQGGALVPCSIDDASIELSDGTGRRLWALAYNDEGRDGDAVAGDLRYSHRFVPSQVPALSRPLHVHLAATVSAGRQRARISRVFSYATHAPLSLRAVRDEPRAGSLVLPLELDVNEAGLYTFEANLMSADGLRPIAWLKQSFRLAQGRREVELTVHGRIFHDVGLDGPYQLRDLRALLRSPRPDEAPMLWSTPQTHLTRPYVRADFSAAEWSSPFRQAQLEQLQRLRDEAASGRTGNTGPAPHIVVDERGFEHRVPAPP